MTEPIADAIPKITSLIIRIQDADDRIVLVEIPNPQQMELDLSPRPDDSLLNSITGPPIDLFQIPGAGKARAKLTWVPSRSPDDQVRISTS